MRLDKFLSITGTASRTEAKRAVRSGSVTVNGLAVSSPDAQVDPDRDIISFGGRMIEYNEYVYIMLNKPEGYVSATEDGKDLTVLELLPADLRRRNLFPCGRLDKNTVGLMLITDDGELAHKLLAPKSHVTKKYRFASKFPVTRRDAERFSSGLTLEDGYVTKPAGISLEYTEDIERASSGVITLTEGKYHQIKRMLQALDNKITYLERLSFGNLTLDGKLARGEWRYLTGAELSGLRDCVMQKNTEQ